METETTIYEEASLGQRLRQKRILGKLPLLSVLVLIISGAVVAATSGILLGRIHTPQAASAFTLTVTPDPSTNSAALGNAFAFRVTVANPSSQAASASLGLLAGCPINGNATVSGSAPTTLNAGADTTFDACQVGGLHTSSQTIAAAGSTNFYFNVTYGGASGSYQWTFTAYS